MCPRNSNIIWCKPCLNITILKGELLAPPPSHKHISKPKQDNEEKKPSEASPAAQILAAAVPESPVANGSCFR